jgi:hypothetical protein
LRKGAQIPDPRISWPTGHEPASSRVFAQNSVDVEATPETVWRLLVDCVQWPSWYEHCSDVSILRGGPILGPGSQFKFKTIGFFFEPVVATFNPYRELSWWAKGPAGTSGAHAWLIEKTPSGCRVITEEAQKGLLLALVGGRTRRRLLAAHETWLRSLKRLAEPRTQQNATT